VLRLALVLGFFCVPEEVVAMDFSLTPR